MSANKLFLRHEQQGLTSNTTRTLNIPAIYKITSLALRFSTSADADVTEAAIRSEIGNIRLTVNGEDIINATAAELLDLYEALGNKVYNNTGVASVLELLIGRLLYNDPAVRDQFGLGTKNVQSIQIAVTAGTLSTIANVQAYTERKKVDEVQGAYHKFITNAISFNSTGEHTVDTLSRNPTADYLLLMVNDGASGVISHGEVRVNGQIRQEKTPNAVNNLIVSNANLAPVSGYFIYTFTNGSLNERLPMAGVNDFRILTTFSTAPGAGGYTIGALSVENMPKEIPA